MANPLPYRQAKILGFLRSYIAEYGFAPSIREIATAAGLKSTSTVAYNLDQLARKGYIIRLHGRQALCIPSLAGEMDQVNGQREELYGLVEEALFMFKYGVRPDPCGTEEWSDWDQRAEACLRALMPAAMANEP